MTLHVTSCTHAPIRLLEPPIMALPDSRVEVHPFPDDDWVVLWIGSNETPGQTILIERHLLTAIWATLRSIDEGFQPIADLVRPLVERAKEGARR